jgi:predicted short-subunit dehydrogenase-like oxidoreductase (DUF2520 family)
VIRLVLIGTGNVAQRLFDLWKREDSISVVQVIGRNSDRLSYFKDHSEVALIDGIIGDADIYLLAVSDDAIGEVSHYIKGAGKLIVHTSGTVAIQALPEMHRRGVFYPLQTFSNSRPPDLKNVPICIEAGRAADLEILRQLGSILSGNVIEVNSEKRKILHLAAVFANNFANLLYHISQEVLESEQLSRDLLYPLIAETTEKLKDSSAFDAQTGPARRGDDATLHQHLRLIKNERQRRVYALLSNSIRNTYVEKL